MRVEQRAGFARGLVGDLALEGDERAVAVLLQLLERADHRLDHLGLLPVRAEERAAADLGEDAAQFGLEDNDERGEQEGRARS